MNQTKILNKNIVRIITIIITILTMASCTEEPKVVNQGINNNLPNIVYYQSIDPSYNVNPLDSVGYWHNEIIDYFINHSSGTDTTQSVYRQELLTVFGQMGDSNFAGTNRTLNEYMLNFVFDSLSVQSEEYIVNHYGTSEYAKTKITQLYALANKYTDSTEGTTAINNMLNEIKGWENNIMSELNYYTYDSSNNVANQLLGTSSILRWSVAYWYTVFNDNTNAWWRYIDIPKGKANPINNNPKTKIAGLNAYAVAVGVGCALADASGFFAGYTVWEPLPDGESGPPTPRRLKGTAGAAAATSDAFKYYAKELLILILLGGW